MSNQVAKPLNFSVWAYSANNKQQADRATEEWLQPNDNSHNSTQETTAATTTTTTTRAAEREQHKDPREAETMHAKCKNNKVFGKRWYARAMRAYRDISPPLFL
jgi:phage repressor protein C with HTH and peptisase S24 domain